MQNGHALPERFPVLLRDSVYENLRTDILTCRLAPGDDAREQELAERCAVSLQQI
jgi:DNA-binding GntR family transcriptional regulator